MLATLFYNPMMIPATMTIWLVIPLCVAVAVVYKTVRVPYVEGLAIEIVKLVAYLLAGLAFVACALWLVVWLVTGG